MQINPYLSFNGQCEAAFTFYERCLGAQLGAIFRYAGTPLAHHAALDPVASDVRGPVQILARFR